MASRISPVHCIFYSNLCLPCQYLVLSVYCDFQITHIQLYSLKIDCQLHKKFLCRKPLVRSFESTYRSKVALMPREQHPVIKKPRDILLSPGFQTKYANIRHIVRTPCLAYSYQHVKIGLMGIRLVICWNLFPYCLLFIHENLFFVNLYFLTPRNKIPNSFV